MGLFDSLLGKITGTSNQTNTSNPGSFQANSGVVGPTQPTQNTRIDEKSLIMLALSEKFKVGEKKYPEYIQSKYGIPFPGEILTKLANSGLIRPSNGYESLAKYSGAELKDLCTRFGLKTSGKKEDLCQRLTENVAPAAMESQVMERYWIITDAGHGLLQNYPYIQFYLEDHKYFLESIGLDLPALTRVVSRGNSGRFRDKLWGEFNRLSTEYYQKAVKSRNFHEYCELLHVMALFLEEEGRYNDALSMYMRYMHYRTNFVAGLAAINMYAMYKKVNEAADTLFIDAEILPFIAKEILELSGECDYDSQQLQSFMLQTLSKETDTGVFTPAELVEFIMYGLNKDKAGQEKMCKKAMQSAKVKMGGKR